MLHAGVLAAAACVRCGRFVCVDCLGARRFVAPTEPECPDCRVVGAAARRDRAIRHLRAERWIFLVVLGVITAATSAMLVLPHARQEFGTEPTLFLALTVSVVAMMFGMPLWIGAVLFGAGRRVWLGWLGLVFELGGLLLWLSALPDGNRAQLFVWPLAVYGISRTWRLRALLLRQAAAVART